MKRLFDLILALMASIFLAVPLLIIALLVFFTSSGGVLYWSDRVGRKNEIFKMPKFRSMRTDAPVIASHLLVNSEKFITPIGIFLRKSSLDELPQLWSILKGDMSFVGPRPALFNQYDLVSLRSQYRLDELTPGLTGWAQVNGRDELSIEAKVQFEIEYLQNQSFWLDLKILGLTVSKVVRSAEISH